jgi:vesicular inhibitory amino acid transporter
MASPKQYPSMVNISFTVTFLVYSLLASVGYLMFGIYTREEISLNLPQVEDYNPLLTQITVWLVALNPITKYPLSINPINTQIERMVRSACSCGCLSPFVFRLICRTLVSLAVLLVAIVFPGFHYVMAILGSFFSFTVSVVFPELCHLKLYGNSLSWRQVLVSKFLIYSGGTLGLIGTIWAFLPLDLDSSH